MVHLYSAFITKSQRRFTMINLPPADWKHIQAQIAAASKQSMHAGTHFTDLGRMESWVNFSGKEVRQIFHSRQNREWNPGPYGPKAEILPLHQPLCSIFSSFASSHSSEFLTIPWQWRWLPLEMLKRQAPPTVFLRPHFSLTIKFDPTM